MKNRKGIYISLGVTWRNSYVRHACLLDHDEHHQLATTAIWWTKRIDERCRQASLWLDQRYTSERKCVKWTTCFELPVEIYYMAVTSWESQHYCIEKTSQTNTHGSREDIRKQTMEYWLILPLTCIKHVEIEMKIWNLIEKRKRTKYIQVNEKFCELKGRNIGIAEGQRRQDLIYML